MAAPPIVCFKDDGEPVAAPIDVSRVLAGHPVATVDNRYSSADAKFHTGIWTSTVGHWRVRYTEQEYCVLICGRARLESDDGISLEFGPGDAFLIPPGFSGTWETLEDCVKHYVVYDPT